MISHLFHPGTHNRVYFFERANGDVIVQLVSQDVEILSQGAMSRAEAGRMARKDRSDGFITLPTEDGIKTSLTHPIHETIGNFYGSGLVYGIEGTVIFYCDSYDARQGYWMTPVSHKNTERRNVSIRAIDRTFMRACLHGAGWYINRWNALVPYPLTYSFVPPVIDAHLEIPPLTTLSQIHAELRDSRAERVNGPNHWEKQPVIE